MLFYLLPPISILLAFSGVALVAKAFASENASYWFKNAGTTLIISTFSVCWMFWAALISQTIYGA